MKGRDTRYIIILGIGALVVALDQLTKFWVMHSIPEYTSVPVIEGFFDLVNIRNRGAAFGFLNRSDIEWQFWLFLGATILALGAILTLARSARLADTPLFFGLGCIFGGAVGNLVDRIRFRAVVDFLDVYVGQWHWPAFNVADMGICVGAMLVFLSLWRTPCTPRASSAGAGAAKKKGGKRVQS